jgi:myo-inositol-1-phosphate synthase
MPDSRDYYKKARKREDSSPGVMHFNLGGYVPANINVVAAFDIDKRKVGKSVSEAILSKPNCTKVFHRINDKNPVKVYMGNVLDSVADHMIDYPEERRFVLSDSKPADIVKILKQTKAEILLNYLPVGSEKATAFYAEACLKSGLVLLIASRYYCFK